MNELPDNQSVSEGTSSLVDESTQTHIEGSRYKWKLPYPQGPQAFEFAQIYNLSVPLVQTLFTRGISTREHFDRYLFSIAERDVPSARLLKDAERAVDRILKAIENKEKILVCGDYDVDGITSSAMMMHCLLPLGAQINFFLPHRVRDGYGLSVKTIERAANSGYTVLITVDNGITAFEPAKVARQRGIDLIITDHHRPHDHLPEAYAIIDPHQSDCGYPYKTLAGVGVSFKILSLLYEKLGKSFPPKVYELLLLGTIADVVPLTGENRYWVRHGLRLVNQTESESLRVLKTNARVTKPVISSTDIGFFLTPQINALGRLEDARQGVKFLIGTDIQETEHVGALLKELNEARKAIEKSIYNDIDERIARKEIDVEHERIIIASSTDWPPGVIGLVASRLMNTYNRPVILLHKHGDIAKGSCRSVPSFNIFEALNEHKDILLSFGGHAMAAGLSLPLGQLEELKRRLEGTLARALPVIEPKAELVLDGEITLPEVNKKMMADIAYFEPFGNENPKPTFLLRHVSLIEEPQLLKEAHIKCMIFADGVIKPLIIFNRPDLYDFLRASMDRTISCAVQVTENYFNGRTSIELQAVDIHI